eukprot:3531297-Rhodomonas_salina.1
MGWHHTVPRTFWMYSFKHQRVIRMCDPSFRQHLFPFAGPSCLVNKQFLTDAHVIDMHCTDTQTLYSEFTDEEEQAMVQDIQRERNEDSRSSLSAVSGETVSGESVMGQSASGESSEQRSVTRSQAQSHPAQPSAPPPAQSTILPQRDLQQPSTLEFEASSNPRQNHRKPGLMDSVCQCQSQPKSQSSLTCISMQLAPEWQSDNLYEGDNVRFQREPITMVARELKSHKGACDRQNTSTR